MKWKILSSEYLFNDLWFKVRKDRCLTPEGTIVDPYYVYEFPTWVTAVALTEDGKVIMEHQYRHALGEVCLEIPGGCVDDADANYEDAIKRELLEETGYSFTSYEYLGKISANPSTNSNLMHMYLARGGKKVTTQHLDAGEEIKISLHTIEEVKEMLRKNEILQAMHVACLMYAFQKLEG
ncbi:MAG: NUDIX hydrolase [Sphingobacteriales bacterium]|nr:NUDIX hydrolase [Sphingobacteriales bacterium]OJV99630.1 MAG: DNA mismatch repair protein MutT [Sphingobacteriales bacterium 44-61]